MKRIMFTLFLAASFCVITSGFMQSKTESVRPTFAVMVQPVADLVIEPYTLPDFTYTDCRHSQQCVCIKTDKACLISTTNTDVGLISDSGPKIEPWRRKDPGIDWKEFERILPTIVDEAAKRTDSKLGITSLYNLPFIPG